MDRTSRRFPLLSFLRCDGPLLDSCTEDGCPDHLLDGSLLLIVKYRSKKGKQRELGSSPIWCKNLINRGLEAIYPLLTYKEREAANEHLKLTHE